MAEVNLINLTKRFGKNVLAVKDVNLDVVDGEFLVLLGPSGCGKTTTMRMIAGLEEVTEGTILIDGKDVTDLPPRKRNISMIFQNYAVWPHMTVFENISYALKLKKMKKEEIKKIVDDVARMTKIGELLERYPAQLSGGQQQRVAVARAIAVSPEVFLMDEPLSNLDAKLRSSMRTELKAIHAQTNATSVFVTHDQSEAMSMADRIVIMREGEIVQIGTPDEVYNESASIFVADFIGTPPTNFMDVELTTVVSNNIQIANQHMKMDLDGASIERLHGYHKKAMVMGIRPENIKITDAETAVFSAPCFVSEPQGSHQIVAVEVDGNLMKLVAPPQPPIRPGDTIHMSFKQDAMLFFDKETGLRI